MDNLKYCKRLADALEKVERDLDKLDEIEPNCVTAIRVYLSRAKLASRHAMKKKERE